MRLLSLTLPLLLISSPSLAAPPVPRTTIETIHGCVTHTVSHNVTEPSVAAVEESKPTCNCNSAPVTEAPVAADTANAAETPRTTVETIYECVTHNVVHNVTQAPVAADSKPACTCNVARDTEASVADDTANAVEAEIRMCKCDEKEECRKESSAEMETCMESCTEHIQGYGSNTTDYLTCFKKNNASIIEAESCLFKDISCNKDKEIKQIKNAKWDELTTIEYTSETDKAIVNNTLWKREGQKYNNIQNFFHCTKHCMHEKFHQCTTDKGCGAKMPNVNDFAAKMVKCTKDNYKIGHSILAACQCLAWQKGVKELQGACGVIGNQFYIDRA